MHEVGCKNGICGHACNRHVLPFDVNLNYRFKNIFFSYLGIIYFLSGLVKECSGQPFYFLFFSKYYTIVPPCGHVWYYKVNFLTTPLSDQDMSVLFHCASVNFAPMSTFLEATFRNKGICLRSVNSFLCSLHGEIIQRPCSHES